MKRIIMIIVIAIMPIMLGFSIVKGTFSTNNEPRFSISVFYDYILVFPTENIDAISYKVGEISHMGFNDSERFNPGWSGSVFEDLEEVGRMIADFFTALWDYIKFAIDISILSISIFIDALVWLFGFPTYLIRY